MYLHIFLQYELLIHASQSIERKKQTEMLLTHIVLNRPGWFKNCEVFNLQLNLLTQSADQKW